MFFISGFSPNHSYYVNSSGSDFDNFGVKASPYDARFYLKLGVGVQFSNFYFAPVTSFFQLMLADTKPPFPEHFSDFLKCFPCISKSSVLLLESAWLTIWAWFSN